MSENKPIIFDIETGPLPEPELRRMLPELDRTKIKGAEILGTLFDPTAVRTGNMTDPAKIKAKIFGFDLPFMFRRMWILGQRVSGKDSLLRNNRQWHENLIDLMKVWGCGVWGEYIKLDTLAKALGVGQKPSEVTGANFHEFWNGTKVQRAKAKAYLVNDLKMTQACAERLGVK